MAAYETPWGQVLRFNPRRRTRTRHYILPSSKYSDTWCIYLPLVFRVALADYLAVRGMKFVDLSGYKYGVTLQSESNYELSFPGKCRVYPRRS